MFDFCQKKLGFSEGEAVRRIVAARLARRFPVVTSLLATGRLNLSTLELLREHLTEENHAELFAAVAGKSKLEVQMIVAARYPRPDRPSRIRREASIEPLSEARFKIEFTASEALCEKLELCRDLMSHANPGRDLAVIIERGVDLLLERLEKIHLGKTRKPRRVGGTRKGKASVGVGVGVGVGAGAGVQERNVPDVANAHAGMRASIARATRREVYERDGVRCTYVSEDGRRCEARAFLELDHAKAKALGGSDDARNLRVLCRAHNQFAAEQVFGREWMERSRHFRQQESTAAVVDSTVGAGNEPRREDRQALPNISQSFAPGSATIFEKVRSALRTMGFRDVEARNAIATVVGMHDAREPPTLEQALREALRVATAA
jgi:hypothetical protein